MRETDQVKECKRILAVHDLSGFGHTSLLAVIPIYNRLGLRVCALPTAILSANTDYPEPRWQDMSSRLASFAAHWLSLNLSFAAIHTGFLASPAQASAVADVIDSLRSESTIVLVDPVMADHGSLYSCYGQEIIPAMRDLCREAELVTPNVTEAALLAGADPRVTPRGDELTSWCRMIAGLGPRHVVITSVPTNIEGILEVVHFDADSSEMYHLPFPTSPGPHPGAGDCFSAFLLAGLARGYAYPASLRAAVEIMSLAIAEPQPRGADPREGIPLERVLNWDLPDHYRD